MADLVLPEVEVTYAIGDIHGCSDALRDLLDDITDHAGDRSHCIVFLGDYIDRGPDSADVVGIVRNMVADGHIALAGNHEDMLIQTVDTPLDASWWISNGGRTTLASFGGDIPQDVLQWMRDLPTLAQDDLRYFVHAGLDPKRTAATTDREGRLWIRGVFLDSGKDFGKHVVHGHTPETWDPEIEPNRTNIDTGCVYGGRLTAAVFDNTQAQPIEFLHASSAQMRRSA